MLLDDTKDKVYVYDLDKEIEDLEREEQDIAFLPEIEKRLTAIPKSVLREKKPENNELVLYRLPTSLTVSEDKDSVRKAIADSRRRAREAGPPDANSDSSTEPNVAHPGSKASLQDAELDPVPGDGDSMDIDE